jgi:hypothetical protein
LIITLIIAAKGTDNKSPQAPKYLPPRSIIIIINTGCMPRESPISLGAITELSNCWITMNAIVTIIALFMDWVIAAKKAGTKPITGPK